MGSDEIKHEIVMYVVRNEQAVRAQFDPPMSIPDYLKALNANNWKRITKQEYHDRYIERVFDCKPFDDQLRAVVTTYKDNGEIRSIVVQGE